MSTFTLTVLPDGRALLTSERDLPDSSVRAIVREFRKWSRTKGGLAVLTDCRVQHATSVEIDLPLPAEGAGDAVQSREGGS